MLSSADKSKFDGYPGSLSYNSGWRSLAIPTGEGSLLEGTGQILVRRRGGVDPTADEVDIRLLGVGVVGAKLADYLTPAHWLPVGFRVYYSERARYTIGNANGSGEISIGIGQASRLILGRTGAVPSTGNNAMQGTITVLTDDPRP